MTVVGAFIRGTSTLYGLQSSFAGVSVRLSYSTFSSVEGGYPNIAKIADTTPLSCDCPEFWIP